MPYRAQLDPINRRLHARLHQKAIAAVDREEACAEACDRIARQYATKVIAALQTDEHHTPAIHRIRAAAVGFWPDIARTIDAQLRGMARWSHQTSVQAYLDVLPPRWFRAIVPQLPLTEAYDPDEPRDASGKWGSGGGASKSKATKPKQAAAKQTDTPEFKAWFGDSKVVDAEGKPLKVFHGKRGDFNQFDLSKGSKTTGNPNAQLGFFFSADPKEASRYSTDFGKKEGASVAPVFLSINNPYEMPYVEANNLAMGLFTAPGASPSEKSQNARRIALDRRNELLAQGFDGISVNTGKPTVEWVAFHPTQIKSATGNRGTFDPKNPNINESLTEEAIGPEISASFGFPPTIPPTAIAAPAPAPGDEDPSKKKKPDDDFTRPIAGDDEYQAAVKELLFPPLDLNTINRIIYTPTAGVGWPQRLEKWSRQFANPDALANNIAVGLSQGQDLGQLSRGVRDSFGVAGSTAKRVARSEAHRVNLMAHDEASKGLGELKAGRQYVAQMDFNTRPTHAIHNGQIFKTGEPTPLTLLEPNCRCSLIDMLAPPDEIEDDPNVKAEFANTAKEEIPDPAAYDQWFQRATEQDRRLAVGTKRYEAVRNIAKYANRKPEWSDFLAGDSGQLLSPAQLSAETTAQRAARKQAVGQLIQQRADDYRSVRNLGFVLQRQSGG